MRTAVGDGSCLLVGGCGIRGAVAALGLAIAFPVGVSAQLGHGWAVTPAGDREIRSVYFDLFETTETWIVIEPLGLDERDRPPITLYVSVQYPGRRLTSTPGFVQVRAQTNLAVQPLRLRTETLSFELDRSDALLLAGPGLSYRLNYPCPSTDGCVYDGLVADLSLVDFFRLLRATEVSGVALGFPFHLRAAHIDALNEFAKTLVPTRN